MWRRRAGSSRVRVPPSPVLADLLPAFHKDGTQLPLEAVDGVPRVFVETPPSDLAHVFAVERARVHIIPRLSGADGGSSRHVRPRTRAGPRGSSSHDHASHGRSAASRQRCHGHPRQGARTQPMRRPLPLERPALPDRRPCSVPLGETAHLRPAAPSQPAAWGGVLGFPR